MKLNNLLALCTRRRMHYKSIVTPLHYYSFKKAQKQCPFTQSRCVSTCAPRSMRIQDDSPSDDEPNYTSLFEKEECARDVLYKNTKDILLNRIYCCASVQELFNVLDNNLHFYRCEDVTQTVCVLYDVMKIYCDVAVANRKRLRESKEEFLENLLRSRSFQNLLDLIERKIHFFDVNSLSYCLLYLTKLGLGHDARTVQLMNETLRKKLQNNFSIGPTSRYLKTVFEDGDLRSYFMSQELIPLVINEIDNCSSASTLHDLTVSLNKLHRVITNEQLDKYKEKIESFIKNGSLTSLNYKVLLQIVAFLNYPKWREKNSVLISKCILLMKNNLSDLNIDEIILLYEIFFKIQEPAEILNDLQRCSSKYFHQLDDVPTKQKLSLFTIMIYFASPSLRKEFQKVVKKYLQECHDYDNLILMKKLLSYVKISDVNVCNLYWDKILKLIKTKNDIDVIELIQAYINFSNDVNNYRHCELEKEILKLIKQLIHDVNYEFFPQKISEFLNFVLLYTDDVKLLEYLVSKLESSWQQLRHSNCLTMSFALRMFHKMENRYSKLFYAKRIDRFLDKKISVEMIDTEEILWKNSVLLKSCVVKKTTNKIVIDTLLKNYTNINHISSKNIESIFYCFLMTNSLVPEVIDNITEYITTYRDHVLGFNAGRVIYLCFVLGYQPKNSFELLENVTNIIIRDRERMTGLALIYVALSLCFFNKLSNSLIRTIFNVEFMDKLDVEVQECYAKDKYPQKVRSNLMQLNRAVCLDYPESKVPWFHQKYVDETLKVRGKRNPLFVNKVRDYLRRIAPTEKAIIENVVTAYGYDIDFVINLNSRDEIVTDSSQISKRLALLLLPESAYTNVTTQLKGNFQLKKRHLEILGYKPIFVKFSDWIGLFHHEDRINFLRNLIWPSNSEINKDVLG